MRYTTTADLIIDLIPDAETAGDLVKRALELGLVVKSVGPSPEFADQFRVVVGTPEEQEAWAQQTLAAMSRLVQMAEQHQASAV